MSHIRPQVHEAKVFFHFRDHGLSPYWALRNLVIHELDGYMKRDIVIGGEEWNAEITYSESGIAPRPSDNVERETLRDYELHLEGPGTEEKVHFNIRARYDDMKNPEGDQVSIPWKGGEGLDVLAQPTNINLERLPYLLAESVGEIADMYGMDFNMRYFREPRPSSRITTVEWYVRINRDHSMNLVEQDGILFRIMNLLAGQEGTKWTYTADNEEIVGHRHAMELEPGNVSKLGPYSAGVRLKCYHPKHVRDEETDDDPLSSPKYGIAFHKSIDGNARAWGDRETLRRQIEELLVNTMEWAEIPTEPDPLVFVSDDHFSVEASELEIDNRSDPTPQIEADQETLLMSVIGELSPAGRDMTKAIATDGGRNYAQLADETDNSVSTIYRVLDEMGGLLESDRGHIDFTSNKIREEIVGMIDRLEELKNDTADRVAQLANVELRSRAGSAFEKWCAKYGAELVDYDGENDGTIRIDTLLTEFRSFHEPHVESVMLEGKDAWKESGRAGGIFERFDVEADLLEGGALASRVEKIIH
jgi:hypothetical protein